MINLLRGFSKGERLDAFVLRIASEIRPSMGIRSTVIISSYKGVWTRCIENNRYCQPLSTVESVVDPLFWYNKSTAGILLRQEVGRTVLRHSTNIGCVFGIKIPLYFLFIRVCLHFGWKAMEVVNPWCSGICYGGVFLSLWTQLSRLRYVSWLGSFLWYKSSGTYYFAGSVWILDAIALFACLAVGLLNMCISLHIFGEHIIALF